MTAKNAYAMYCSEHGSYSEAHIVEIIKEFGGVVKTDTLSDEALFDLKAGKVKGDLDQYDISLIKDNNIVRQLMSMASKVLGSREGGSYSVARIIEIIKKLGGEVKTETLSDERVLVEKLVPPAVLTELAPDLYISSHSGAKVLVNSAVVLLTAALKNNLFTGVYDTSPFAALHTLNKSGRIGIYTPAQRKARR
ncbi:hypothetical protein TrRE_jg3351 [Triparma retinervis]|uniref:Uncharacterized protein n=1 Tax=Triparma retinervis TaxID=2557542 RepID=A0A9W6ZR97_9STRA|nr:hypothetical protein TrRE_jg3351 [Triparma retinervis]